MDFSIQSLRRFKNQLAYHAYYFDSQKMDHINKNNHGYIYFFNALSNASSLSRIAELCSAISKYYGFNHSAVAYLCRGRKKAFECHHIYSEKNEWIEFYRKNLLFIDPFTDHCTRKSVPLFWQKNKYQEQALAGVSPVLLNAFGDFSVNNVVSIPCHGPQGQILCLRFMCTGTEKMPQKNLMLAMPELHSLAGACLGAIQKIIAGNVGNPKGGIDSLSDRELNVLTLMVKGLSAKAIANNLNISTNTVLSHTKNIYAKLGVNKKQLAVAEAISKGMFDI